MHTDHASPERAPLNQVKKQASLFIKQPHIQEVLNSIPNFIVALNSNRQIVFANTAMLNLLQLDDLDPALGKRPGEALQCIHAFETEGGCGTTEFCKTCGAVNATLAAQMGATDIQECRISLINDHSLDLRVMVSPLTKIKGEFTLFSVTDISNEKRREVLERIFFHDILNTAGGIRGFTQLLVETKPADLDTLHKNLYGLADQLIEEVHTQQDLLSAEKNELTIHPEQLNTLLLLVDTKNLYQYHMISKGKTITIAKESTPTFFSSDKVLISRVLGNMTKNALEAIKENETITLSCRNLEDQVEFKVHNSGFINQSSQLQIFKRSFSTKGRGRGIGTYSMKLITEKYLQGEVGFESNEAEGTTFFVRYPLNLAEKSTP